jgi:hypothetical protein
MNLNDLISLLNEVFAYEPGIPKDPWSLIELDLHVTQIARINSIPPDLDDIIQKGQPRGENFEIGNIGSFSLNEVIALSAFIIEVFAIQNRENENQYRQTILDIDWSVGVRNSWFVNDYLQPGPTEMHQNNVKHVVNRLNLKNALDLPANENPWQKTYLLQCGLTKSQWYVIIAQGIPHEAGNAPQIANMLYHEPIWKSESFIQTWQALYQYQEKDITRMDAELELAASHWVPRDWIKELLDQIERARQKNGQNEDSTQIESGCRKSPLALPKLLWGNAPVFESAILTDALGLICPTDCLALILTGPHGTLGEINRASNHSPWQRVNGAGITPELAIRISPQELGSGEVTVELRSLTPESDFFTEVALRLWHDDAIVSRFDHNGLLELDAWNRRLPGGHSVTLTVPIGWSITPHPASLIELPEPGIALANFNGDQRPITICDDNGTSWWNSQKLESPSRRIPLYLRQLKPEFVIDQTRATYVTGHIEVPFEFREMIQQVKIGGNTMAWQAARAANAICVGTGCINTESLWYGLKIELLVTFQEQQHKVLRTAPSRFDPATPGVVLLVRLPTGEVKKLSDDTSIGTMKNFQMASFRAITPLHLQQLSVFQYGQLVGTISKKNAHWGAVQHLGVPFQYSENPNQNENLPVLMQGIEDRGCIASIDLPENHGDAGTISIRLTNPIEPSPATDIHQGHRVLVLMRQSVGNGALLDALALTPDQVVCLPDDDWSSWEIQLPDNVHVICAVAISYGKRIIGSWVSTRNDGIRHTLRGNDLQEHDIELICDCVRLFSPPLFQVGFERDARHFFAKHSLVFDQRRANQHLVSWDGVEIRQSLNPPNWDTVMEALNA